MVVMSEQPNPAARHSHAGADWEIPVDLLEVQRRFDHVNAECARLADGGDQDAYQAACRDRMGEVLALYRHPWLLGQAGAGRRHQADQALKNLARAANG